MYIPVKRNVFHLSNELSSRVVSDREVLGVDWKPQDNPSKSTSRIVDESIELQQQKQTSIFL